MLLPGELEAVLWAQSSDRRREECVYGMGMCVLNRSINHDWVSNV